MMICEFCRSEIVEYITHERQNMKGRIIRRFECDSCGPLDFRTLLPVKGAGQPVEAEIEAQ